MCPVVARHELRSLLGAAQPDRRFAAINGEFPIESSDKRIIIARAEIKSRRGGGPVTGILMEEMNALCSRGKWENNNVITMLKM